VPTAVRVGAGWDRTQPASAAINRFRIDDRALDTAVANTAAALVIRDAVSVADAHLGAIAQALRGAEIVVLISDPRDIERVSAPARVTTVLV
jgi:hypothetical protein